MGLDPPRADFNVWAIDTPAEESGVARPSDGVFEGAMYEARGYYRAQADCIMFMRDEVGFCAVCRRAIERVIRLYARGWLG